MPLSGEITLLKGLGEDVSALSFHDDEDLSVLTPSSKRRSDKSRSSANSRSGSGSALLPRSSRKASEKARLQETQEAFSLCQLRVDELPLFGREEQLEKLNGAFKRSAMQNDRGLVLIRGESGVGKTSLTLDESLQKLLRIERGIFALGKYEVQQGGDEPYAGVLDALKVMCEKISQLPTRKECDTASCSSSTSCSRPEVFIEDVQKKLEEMDKVEWDLLANNVPGLEALMPEQSNRAGLNLQKNDNTAVTKEDDTTAPTQVKVESSSGANYKESSDRLKFVYRHFINAISSICPLVLVLDDIQWADQASFEWMRLLLTDTSARGSLLLVATYRSDEVDDKHKVSVMIEELQKSIELPSRDQDTAENLSTPLFFLEMIEVGNLTVQNVNSILVELISQPQEETIELAKVLHQKTMGNSFFVVQLLLQAKKDGHLSFNLSVMAWFWDLEAIQTEYSSTDNVADLMSLKLKENTKSLSILPVAACLGAAFTPTFLHRVLNGLYVRGDYDAKLSISDVEVTLEQFCSEGFTETQSQGRFRFAHDKIQEAALSLLASSVKICIGEIFLDQFQQEKEKFQEDIYFAVSLANLQLTSTLKDDTKRICIAEMNMLAGKRALESAAFDAAARFLTIAVNLLPDNIWVSNTQTALQAVTLAGAAEFCTGNQKQVQIYADIILSKAEVPLLDKIGLCHTLMESYEVGMESKANLEFGLKLLDGFGCKFPKSGVGITMKTMSGLLKAKLQLKKKLSTESLQSKPYVKDRHTMALMKTLDNVANASFHTKPELLPLVILEMANYTDKLGLNPYAAVSYPILGLLFAGVLEDFETAKICGDAGVAIMKRGNYPVLKARCLQMAYVYALHWTMPVKDCIEPLLEGYQIGIKTGSIGSAFWCICFYLEYSLYTGAPLASLQEDLRTFIPHMGDYNAAKPLLLLRFTECAITKLIDPNHEGANEEYLAGVCKKEGEDALVVCFPLRQMYACSILGEHQKVADLSLVWYAKIMKILPSQVNLIEINFVSALSCMALARQDIKQSTKKKYTKLAKQCHAKIKSWTRKGCPNCVVHGALLDAESMAIKKEPALALRNYETAALLAGRRGLTHLQALSNERFALYLEEIGDTQEAEYRFNEALKLYRTWGAKTKVQQLECKVGDEIANKYSGDF